MPEELSEAEQAALSDCYHSFRARIQVLEWQGRTIRMIAASAVAVMWELVDRLPVAPKTQLLNSMAHAINDRITAIEMEQEEPPCPNQIH